MFIVLISIIGFLLFVLQSCNVAELKAQNEYLEVTLEKVKLDLSKCSKERDHLEEESTRAQFLSSGAKLKLEQMQNRVSGRFIDLYLLPYGCVVLRF